MIFINGQSFGNEYFGNKEAIYKEVDLRSDINIIDFYFEDNGDIANMLMAVGYIKEEKPLSSIDIIFYYLPYSAMDRKINDQIFSLKIFAHIINAQGFRRVYVLDAHNMEVTMDLIYNVEFLDINTYVKEAIQKFNPDVLYFPDKGALAKYPKLLVDYGLPIIHGNKVRDLNNRGKITSYETITDGVNIKGKRVLIIDDICRKGGTFVAAATELKKLGVSDIGLYVSHCEAGIFEGKLLEKDSDISAVYTTNSEPEFMCEMYRMGNREKAAKLNVL